MPASLLGMGNPLLDISAVVDADFLAKYELKNADQILAEDKHLPIYKELGERSDVQYIAGGATQNTVRVAQWMLKEAGSTAYMGCVGDDEYAAKMRSVCASDGVNVQYMVDSSVPTGTCAVCVVDSDRSLVANLAAANNYKVDHLKEADNMKLLTDAKVVYSAGFFVTVSPESIYECAQHCLDEKKIYCMNISAPFIVEVPPFKAVIAKALPMVDFLFGNETEAASFAKSEGWETTDVAEIALKIQQMPGNLKGGLKVVITQGKDDTIVAIDGKVQKFSVSPVEPSQIVDTNGAGDAFVGGFLAALIKGKATEECCKAGNYAASCIIKVAGVAIPSTCEFAL